MNRFVVSAAPSFAHHVAAALARHAPAIHARKLHSTTMTKLTDNAAGAVESLLRTMGTLAEIRKRGQTHVWSQGRSLCGLEYPKRMTSRLPLDVRHEIEAGLLCKNCLAAARKRLEVS